VKMVQWHPTMDILFSCSYDNTIKVLLAVKSVVFANLLPEVVKNEIFPLASLPLVILDMF